MEIAYLGGGGGGVSIVFRFSYYNPIRKEWKEERRRKKRETCNINIYLIILDRYSICNCLNRQMHFETNETNTHAHKKKR
jgi:hypothetical protein